MRKYILLAAVLLTCLGAVSFYVHKIAPQADSAVTPVAEESVAASGEMVSSDPQVAAVATGEEARPVERNTDALIPERGLGDPNAPVRIDEYASLSCSHCADFHLNVYPEFKREFIDTGKVYFVYNDFPTNGPALEAALISRCMPIERYFQFISFLFKEQKNWAYQANYSQILRQNAKVLGASDEMLDQCLANQEKKQALVDHSKEAGEKHGINSTPTFIVNGKDVLRGALPISEYRKAIEKNTPKDDNE